MFKCILMKIPLTISIVWKFVPCNQHQNSCLFKQAKTDKALHATYLVTNSPFI